MFPYSTVLENESNESMKELERTRKTRSLSLSQLEAVPRRVDKPSSDALTRMLSYAHDIHDSFGLHKCQI